MAPSVGGKLFMYLYNYNGIKVTRVALAIARHKLVQNNFRFYLITNLVKFLLWE
jgi:hypothetical protein